MFASARRVRGIARVNVVTSCSQRAGDLWLGQLELLGEEQKLGRSLGRGFQQRLSDRRSQLLKQNAFCSSAIVLHLICIDACKHSFSSVNVLAKRMCVGCLLSHILIIFSQSGSSLMRVEIEGIKEFSYILWTDNNRPTRFALRFIFTHKLVWPVLHDQRL